MKCIDFDKKFEYYVTNWMNTEGKKYKNYDEMEAQMPEVYAAFLDTPADFLNGQKPGEYFEQFDDAKMLVNLMEDYDKQRVPVPDMLLNRISDLGEKSEAPLFHMLQKERAPMSTKMNAITLLREIESELPVDYYIEIVKNQTSMDELTESALESLESLGEKVQEKILQNIEQATDEGKISFLSAVIKEGQSAPVLVDMALELIQKQDCAQIALLSDVLGRLGDERALPVLKALAASHDTHYLDYIELRNAIECLGDEAPEREFDEEDPEYNCMCRLEEEKIKK